MRPTRWKFLARKYISWILTIGVTVLLFDIGRGLLDGDDDAPPPRFQGGIVQPELYSVPSPQPASSPEPSQSHGQPPRPAPGDGTLLVTIQGQDGRPVPAGLEVRLEGSTAKRMRTGQDGTVTSTLDAGTYRLLVDKGCQDRFEIAGPSTATLGVVAGQTTTGSLRITWRHRIRPWHPSFSSAAGTWPIGQQVEVGFYVVDRCKGLEKAPLADYGTFVFDLSPNLEWVAQPRLSSDEIGHGKILIRCKSPGPAKITSRDGVNTGDEVIDLLREDISNPGRPECG